MIHTLYLSSNASTYYTALQNYCDWRQITPTKKAPLGAFFVISLSVSFWVYLLCAKRLRRINNTVNAMIKNAGKSVMKKEKVLKEGESGEFQIAK